MLNPMGVCKRYVIELAVAGRGGHRTQFDARYEKQGNASTHITLASARTNTHACHYIDALDTLHTLAARRVTRVSAIGIHKRTAARRGLTLA